MMSLYDIGERIKLRRKALGMNQDDLAELASLNRVTVAKYETGKFEPGAQALARIADALETSVDELLGRTSPQIDAKTEDEAMLFRERIRRDPNYRILFDAAANATPDHLRAAAAMLRALKGDDSD